MVSGPVVSFFWLPFGVSPVTASLYITYSGQLITKLD
jgi:hypothetical protein